MVDHSPDSDLFTAVLDEKDDLVGFQKPWRPGSLVFLCFFAGPFGGGALMGWNFRKLGMTRWVWPCWLVFAGTGLVAYGVLVSRMVGMDEAGDEYLAKNLLRALWILLALVFAHFQKRRFQIFEAGDEEPASLWIPGIIALLVAMLVTAAVILMFTAMLIGTPPT